MKSKKQNAKFTIELSPTFICSQMVVIPPKYLDDDENVQIFKDSNFHHYFIIRKPKVFFKDIKLTDTTITYIFIIKDRTGDEIYEVESQKIGDFNPTITFNESKSSVKMYNNGELYLDTDASILFQMLCGENVLTDDDCPNCEILYIGQAFGSDGERTAITRLISHSTLQKILADNQDNIYDEIQIILLSFEPRTTYINTMGFLNGFNPEIGIDDSLKHRDFILDNAIPADQKVTMIEASMIKWFEPKYNTEYKTEFPNPKHKSYADGYVKEFNNFCFEFDSRSIGCKLYSEKRVSSFIHIGHIPLYSETQRKDAFSILNEEQ